MTARARIETAGAIIASESVEGFDEMQQEFSPLIARIKALAGVRHTAAHAVWLGLTPRGHMVALDVNAHEVNAGIRRIAWQEHELKAAIGRLNDLTAELKHIVKEHRWHGAGYAIDMGDIDFS